MCVQRVWWSDCDHFSGAKPALVGIPLTNVLGENRHFFLQIIFNLCPFNSAIVRCFPLICAHMHLCGIYYQWLWPNYCKCNSLGVIKNNAWFTVNNDFFVASEAIRQWFSRVTKSRVKIIAESPHEWQKIVINGNECIILFLTRYSMSWTHKSAMNYHRALISPLLPRAAFSDRALWRHYNWSVTSCEREMLVLWSHICLLSLHAQIGA